MINSENKKEIKAGAQLKKRAQNAHKTRTNRQNKKSPATVIRSNCFLSIKSMSSLCPRQFKKFQHTHMHTHTHRHNKGGIWQWQCQSQLKLETK